MVARLRGAPYKTCRAAVDEDVDRFNLYSDRRLLSTLDLVSRGRPAWRCISDNVRQADDTRLLG